MKMDRSLKKGQELQGAQGCRLQRLKLKRRLDISLYDLVMKEGEKIFPQVVPFEAPEPRKMAGRPVD